MLARKDDKNLVCINKSYQPRNDKICQRIKHKINIVYWIAYTKPGQWAVVYSCVGGSILFLFTICLLDFGTVPAVWYICVIYQCDIAVWYICVICQCDISIFFLYHFTHFKYMMRFERYPSKQKSILKLGLCLLINPSAEI